MNDKQTETWDRLAAFFDPDEVKWKPQSVKGNRALAIAYVDARVVMDRLDEVLGLGNWQTTYREGDMGVVCHLRARVGGEWFEHEDVGSFSEQPDDGDKLKAAYSDALKRVAVHLGIGRYLYRLPHQWVDFDPQKRSFVSTPKLPRWAVPAEHPAPRRPAPTPEKEAPPTAKTASPLPANGVELHKRLTGYDGRLAREGLCQPGDLLRTVAMDGVSKRHYPPSITAWDSEEQILFAVETVKATEARWRTPPKEAAPPPTPAGKITPEQVRKLKALADEVGESEADIANAYRHKDKTPKQRIEDLTPAEWLVAMDLLSSRQPEAVAAE
jgi:hypothetical protein